MRERFEIELTKADYVLGLEALSSELVKRDAGRGNRIYERLVAITLLILATTYFYPESARGIFAVIIGWALLEWLLIYRWTKAAHGVSFDPAVYPAAIDINDEGIVETGPQRIRRWQWDAVRKLHIRDAALVFEFAGWDMIVLPNRLWGEPGARDRFADEVRGRLSDRGEDVVSAAPPLMSYGSDILRLGAIGAFIDMFLVVSMLFQAHGTNFAPLVRSLGLLGTMLFYLLVSAAVGYVAYRILRAGLPRLHKRSPLAAMIVAHFFIWAFAVWMLGSSFGLW
jgi:hypothetical protein